MDSTSSSGGSSIVMIHSSETDDTTIVISDSSSSVDYSSGDIYTYSGSGTSLLPNKQIRKITPNISEQATQQRAHTQQFPKVLEKSQQPRLVPSGERMDIDLPRTVLHSQQLTRSLRSFISGEQSRQLGESSGEESRQLGDRSGEQSLQLGETSGEQARQLGEPSGEQNEQSMLTQTGNSSFLDRVVTMKLDGKYQSKRTCVANQADQIPAKRARYTPDASSLNAVPTPREIRRGIRQMRDPRIVKMIRMEAYAALRRIKQNVMSRPILVEPSNERDTDFEFLDFDE